MAADVARQARQPCAYSTLAADILERAIQQGLGEQDFTTLYRHLDELLSTNGPEKRLHP